MIIKISFLIPPSFLSSGFVSVFSACFFRPPPVVTLPRVSLSFSSGNFSVCLYVYLLYMDFLLS